MEKIIRQKAKKSCPVSGNFALFRRHECNKSYIIIRNPERERESYNSDSALSPQSKKITRRRFLRRSGASAAGAAVLGLGVGRLAYGSGTSTGTVTGTSSGQWKDGKRAAFSTSHWACGFGLKLSNSTNSAQTVTVKIFVDGCQHLDKWANHTVSVPANTTDQWFEIGPEVFGTSDSRVKIQAEWNNTILFVSGEISQPTNVGSNNADDVNDDDYIDPDEWK